MALIFGNCAQSGRFCLFVKHVYLAFQCAVVGLAALVCLASEYLFKVVIGSYYSVAFTFLTQKPISHYLIKLLGGSYVKQSFAVGRVGDYGLIAVG